ncbi:MAG: OmpH family outer membrane protein [Bacteroidales bacterium]|jgi:outer membrane protein|nr:OmpH family outer membrane protein [Bacteroidales bacterium]
MKKTTHILSALAMGAVVAFGAVSCNQTKTAENAEAPAAETAEACAPKGAIVYIDMTKVMAEYDMANDLRAVVETKVSEIQAEITRRETNLANAVTKYQDRMQKGLMTRSVAEVEAEKLQKQEIEFNNYANQKNNEINEELLVMNNQINDAIATFVKKYNEEKQYAMIIVSQGDAEGDGVVTLSAPVLTADPSLDITDAVLAGLNEEYIASKNSK